MRIRTTTRYIGDDMNRFEGGATNSGALRIALSLAMKGATPDYFEGEIQLWDKRVLIGKLTNEWPDGRYDCASEASFDACIGKLMVNVMTRDVPFVLWREDVNVLWKVRYTPEYFSNMVISDTSNTDLAHILADMNIAQKTITPENKWVIVLRLNEEINRRIPDFGIVATELEAGWQLSTYPDATARIKFENRFADTTHTICDVGEVLRQEIKYLSHVMAKIIEHEPS